MSNDKTLGVPASPSGSPLQSSEDGRISASIPIAPAHTPGPWEVSDVPNVYSHKALGVAAKGGYTVADVWMDVAELEVRGPANARLIAAAPELLAALVKVSDAIHEAKDPIQLAAKMLPLCADIDAAIAKASQP